MGQSEKPVAHYYADVIELRIAPPGTHVGPWRPLSPCSCRRARGCRNKRRPCNLADSNPDFRLIVAKVQDTERGSLQLAGKVIARAQGGLAFGTTTSTHERLCPLAGSSLASFLHIPWFILCGWAVRPGSSKSLRNQARGTRCASSSFTSLPLKYGAHSRLRSSHQYRHHRFFCSFIDRIPVGSLREARRDLDSKSSVISGY